MFHGQGPDAPCGLSGLAAARVGQAASSVASYTFIIITRPGSLRVCQQIHLVARHARHHLHFRTTPTPSNAGGRHASPAKPGVLPSVCKQSAHITTPIAVLPIRVQHGAQNIRKQGNYSSLCGCWNTRMFGTTSWTTDSIRWPAGIHNRQSEHTLGCKLHPARARVLVTGRRLQAAERHVPCAPLNTVKASAPAGNANIQPADAC